MKTLSKALVLAAFSLVLLVGLVLSFRVGPVPDIEIRPELPAIGARTPVVVTATGGGRGLASLRLEVVQQDRATVLAERSYQTRPVWALNHLQEPYKNCQNYRIEQAGRLVETSLCLPSSTNLSGEDVQLVIAKLNG